MSNTRLKLLAVLVLSLVLGASAAGAGAHAGDHRLAVDRLTLDEANALPYASRHMDVVRATTDWCGTQTKTDQGPNALAGYPAHWIYAIPSDGQDRLASFASAMQSDAESIDAWWRSQDGTRSPRNDLAQFSCGAQLDITALRLSESSSQLSPEGSRFETIVNAANAAGFGSRFDKYIVYYDGLAPSDVCGEGGSFSSGLGYALVYVQACSGVPASVVAVHELVHTYGAVPTGAPHMCPEPNAFHVCDDTHDLMYPFADGTPLSGLRLDAGHDDYYGHGGAWFDIQDSPWLVQRDRQVPFPLSIAGAGVVDSDLPGLQCSESCTTTWNADTVITLTATPATGMKFVRWGGACSGSFTCQVTVAQGVTTSALFAPARYRLSVRVAGRGAVRSSSGGISCPKRCSADVSSYTPVRLTAKSTKGWRFRSWLGSCHGKSASCTLPMSNDTSARAVFVRS
jgi:hypothetical protein